MVKSYIAGGCFQDVAYNISSVMIRINDLYGQLYYIFDAYVLV